jgi:hypothetical protein
MKKKPYPKSLSDLVKACKEPAKHKKMRRWTNDNKVTWLLKKDRFCRKCGATFPKGSSVGKFLRHVRICDAVLDVKARREKCTTTRTARKP